MSLNPPAFVRTPTASSRLSGANGALRFLFPRVQQKTYRDFRLQGVLDATLNSKSYETIYNRLTVEEATAAVKAGDGLQGISMRDSDEEDD